MSTNGPYTKPFEPTSNLHTLVLHNSFELFPGTWCDLTMQHSTLCLALALFNTELQGLTLLALAL